MDKKAINAVCFYFILGPLTYTKENTTTIYGIVSKSGISGPQGRCLSPKVYFRVNTPDALKWIESFQESNINLTKPTTHYTKQYIV